MTACNVAGCDMPARWAANVRVSFTRTLRLRVKREAYPWLDAAATEVNQVWNAVNERASSVLGNLGRWASGFELVNYTSGTTQYMDRIGADTIQRVCTDTSAFVEAMQRALPAIVEQQNANDPKKLKARIAELERQVANLDGVAMRATSMTDRERRLEVENEQQAERIATLEADNRALEQHRDAIDRQNLALRDALDAARNALVSIRERAEGLLATSVPPFPTLTKPSAPAPAARANTATSPPVRPAATSAPRPRANGADHGLPPAQFKILRALYWLRDEERTPEKVGFYAGYSASSGHFGNMIGALRSAGLAAGFNITADGIALVSQQAGEKPAGTELREWLRPKLEHAQNKMLDVLIAAGGRRLSNEELGTASGYAATSGHFGNMIGGLRTVGAAEGYEKDGGVRAAEVFLS